MIRVACSVAAVAVLLAASTAVAAAAAGDTTAGAVVADAPAPSLPSISVKLSNATFQETARALNKALGVHLAFDDATPSPNRYTIDAQSRPFWEVFRTLSKQHPLRLIDDPLASATGEGLRLGQDPWTTEGLAGWVDFDQRGDAIVIPGAFSWRRNVSLQPPSARELALPGRGGDPGAPALMYHCEIALDPRVRVLRTMGPQGLGSTDDRGNVLMAPPPPPAPAQNQGSRGFGNVESPDARFQAPGRYFFAFEKDFLLTLPAQPGAKASFSGVFKYEAFEETARAEIPDLRKSLNHDVKVGSQAIQFQRIDTNTPTRGMMLTQIRLKSALTDPKNVYLILRDADDWELYSGQLRQSTSVSGRFREPLKAVLVTGTPRQHTVSFAFKDIPLPKVP